MAKKKIGEVQPQEGENRFQFKTLAEQYRETLEMIQLDKSQTELEVEVKHEQIAEMQAAVEELTKKAADLARAEKSLKKLLGDEVEEEEEQQVVAPINIGPFFPCPVPTPYVPYVPPSFPGNGGIWTTPNNKDPYGGGFVPTTTGGTAWPTHPAITYESKSTPNMNNGPMDFQSCAISNKDIADAMIAGHMSWTTSGSASA